MLSARYVFSVPVDDLRSKLDSCPDLWDANGYRKDLFCHNDMSDIWVRYNAIENMGAGFNDEHSSVWYPAADRLPEALRIVFTIMMLVKGERLGGVLITRLKPGGKILRHVDDSWHSHYYDKFLVPIQNEAGAEFFWDDFSICPVAGDVYEFCNTIPHWVENNSASDRIVMIVCIKKCTVGV